MANIASLSTAIHANTQIVIKRHIDTHHFTAIYKHSEYEPDEICY